MSGQAFGVIGLEVMGRNIALNIERNGFPIAVYIAPTPRPSTSSTSWPREEGKGFETVKDFVAAWSARGAS